MDTTKMLIQMAELKLITEGVSTVLQFVCESGRLPSRAEFHSISPMELPGPALKSFAAIGFSVSKPTGKHLESSIRLAELSLLALRIFKMGNIFQFLTLIAKYLIAGDPVNHIRPCGRGYEVERQNEIILRLIRQIEAAGFASELSKINWLADYFAAVKISRVVVDATVADDFRFMEKDVLMLNCSEVALQRFGRMMWLGALPISILELSYSNLPLSEDGAIDVTTAVLLDEHSGPGVSEDSSVRSPKLNANLIELAIKKALEIKDSLHKEEHQPIVGMFNK
jgi:hypothetical protein